MRAGPRGPGASARRRTHAPTRPKRCTSWPRSRTNTSRPTTRSRSRPKPSTWPTTGEPNLTLAWSLHLIGVVHYQASNFAVRARSVSAGDPGLPRRPSDDIDEGKILHTIAAVYQSMGDYDRAITTYESALAINEPLGRRDLDAMVIGNLARIRGRRGEYLPAVSLGRKAVELSRDHAPHLVGGLLADLAEAYVGLADHASAALCFAEARADWEYRIAEGGELDARRSNSA